MLCVTTDRIFRRSVQRGGWSFSQLRFLLPQRIVEERESVSCGLNRCLELVEMVDARRRICASPNVTSGPLPTNFSKIDSARSRRIALPCALGGRDRKRAERCEWGKNSWTKCSLFNFPRGPGRLFEYREEGEQGSGYTGERLEGAGFAILSSLAPRPRSLHASRIIRASIRRHL